MLAACGAIRQVFARAGGQPRRGGEMGRGPRAGHAVLLLLTADVARSVVRRNVSIVSRGFHGAYPGPHHARRARAVAARPDPPAATDPSLLTGFSYLHKVTGHSV